MMITAIILAKNEQKNIEKCLQSLKFCDQVVVVDDGSTDDTVAIAKRLGVQVLEHKLGGDYAAARNWALEQVKSPWVLFVDADEHVSPELAREIKRAVEKVECKGFLIPRRDYLWGRQLRHGDVGGVKILRLARRGAGKWVGSVHETWRMERKVCQLHQPLWHYPHPEIASFLRQINRYSSIRAQELWRQGTRSNLGQIIFYPQLKFTYLYVFKLGCLDGTAGFVHAMIMAFYSFLVRGKLWLLWHSR